MGGVYFIASYDVTDAERYEREYVPGVVASLAAAAGGTVRIMICTDRRPHLVCETFCVGFGSRGQCGGGRAEEARASHVEFR